MGEEELIDDGAIFLLKEDSRLKRDVKGLNDIFYGYNLLLVYKF